jgi:hypothetical protein
MARVTCDVHEVDLDGDDEDSITGVCVVCQQCGHAAEVRGTEERSVKRGLVMLREGCPREESNFYVAAED